MNIVWKTWYCTLLLMPAAVPALAQSNAQAEAGEPRANAAPAPGSPPTPHEATQAAPAPTAAPNPTAPATANPTAPASATSAAPAVTAAAPAGAHGASKAGAAPRGPGGPAGADRLNLNTATVTGDREQPKVMYVVPWKSSNIGDLSGKPMNSLLDEALSPVDREEFKREVAYYDAVRPAAKQGEK